MPTVGELWEDCPAEYDFSEKCDWSVRFPGLWGHAFVNLLYATVAVATLAWVASAARDLRDARAQRFSAGAQPGRYDSARYDLNVACGYVALVAAIPIIAALA